MRWILQTALLLSLLSLWLIGCSSSKNDPQNYSREIAQHTESIGNTNVVIKVIEERKNGVNTIRIQTIKDGNIKETVHAFESDNFKISVPISASIQEQTNTNGQTVTNTNVLAFSQKLELVRESMMKTDYIEALEAVNEALKMDSYNPQAHMMKGSILYAMGKHKLASKEFDYVLKVDPSNVEIKRFKSYIESQNVDSPKVTIDKTAE